MLGRIWERAMMALGLIVVVGFVILWLAGARR